MFISETLDSEDILDKNQNLSTKPTRRLYRQRRRSKRWLKWLLSFLLLAVAVVAVFAGIAWHNLRSATDNMYNKSNQTTRGIDRQMDAKKPISFLLLGTDTGALGRDYKGRTDTIMIIVLNPTTRKTTIVSLPRDMKVNLPGYSQYSPSKINAAYTYGGVDETIEVVKDYFKIPIYGYALVNMGGLEKSINQVGGVNVTSPLTFDYEGYHFDKGQTYHMNGAKALAFSRMRYTDPHGDYGRQQRQRLIIMALLKESASYRTVLNSTFLNGISKEMQTDLTMSRMLKLATGYRTSLGKVNSTFAQGTSANISGVSFEVVSAAERQRIITKLRRQLGLNPVTIN